MSDEGNDRQEYQAFLDRFALPLLSEGEPQDHPVVAIVTGQPGAGKTGLLAVEADRFASRGGAVRIDLDRVKMLLPDFERMAIEIDSDVYHHDGLARQAWKWVHWAIDYATERRVNIVLEHGLSPQERARELLGRFVRADYRIELAIVATPGPVSLLSIVSRCVSMLAVNDVGRLVYLAKHDERYDRVPEVATEFEAVKRVSAMRVYRRGVGSQTNAPLYENERDGSGDWEQPPRARETMERERDRWSSPEEKQHFDDLHDSLSTQIEALADDMPRLANEMRALLHEARQRADRLPPPHTPQNPTDPDVDPPSDPTDPHGGVPPPLR